MEASGVPVRVKLKNSETYLQNFQMIAYYKDATIYPMSELLNLECQKMYAGYDPKSGGRSFIFGNIDNSGSDWDTHYHTKGILEIYMTLDTTANPPIFDLKVLVSEGKSDELTECPNNWPAAYWYTGKAGQPTDSDGQPYDFRKYRVHVSQASWKLYNLAPLFH